jgi:tRNA(fMet)-specific endonuclease VapC
MFLLDSNAWIAIFRQKSDALLKELKGRSAGEIVLCSVVLSELWYGVCRSSSVHRAKNQRLVEDVQARYASVPLDDAAALNAAELRAHLATSGQAIGPYDVLIAAIARTRGLTLVAHNVTEFARVPGLVIEDWQRIST